MSKNFLNMHVLISHSPSCLNRDDMNMQKSAVFGGKRRVRVSSQSLKRAIRTSDAYEKRLGSHSVRTRELSSLLGIAQKALQERFDNEVITTAIEWIAGKEGIALEEGVQASAMAPWALGEIALVCEQIIQGKAEEIDDSKLQKQIEKNSKKLKAAFENSIDIALAGRMATSGLMTSVDGALAVAHAITTHTVDADIDWFTAVDDLIIEEGDVGAGHLNTQEFSSGVFYRYASLNIPQLQANLGDCSRERALEIAAHVMHLFATIVPSAKQQTFAAHNLADTVLLSFADQPLSLANAFETPVQADRRDGGFRLPSTLALIDHYKKLSQAYGLAADSRLFTLLGAETEMDTVVSINELAQWITAQE